MLVIRCAACKEKLWKYDKVGKGKVLRCHKARIMEHYVDTPIINNKVRCPCGKEIGIDKGRFFKMDAKAFTYTGTKRNG